MVVCVGWFAFFLIRCFGEQTERRVPCLLASFFFAASVLYTNHWLFFSGHPSTVGEGMYVVANLCVYPLYYAYLRALTRTKRNWEIPVLLLPAVLVAVLYPLGWHLLFARVAFAVQVVWVLVRGYRLVW